jgi:hypothetical protein
VRKVLAFVASAASESCRPMRGSNGGDFQVQWLGGCTS